MVGITVQLLSPRRPSYTLPCLSGQNQSSSRWAGSRDHSRDESCDQLRNLLLQEMLRLRVGLIQNVMVLELSRAMNCTREPLSCIT